MILRVRLCDCPIGIRLCDLRLDRTPTAQLFGKGRKIRTVPLMANTVGKLKNYISVFHKRESMLSEKPLFYVERKGQLQSICDDTVRIRIRKYADAAREKCGDVPETVYPPSLAAYPCHAPVPARDGPDTDLPMAWACQP